MIEEEFTSFDGTWLTINLHPYLDVCLRISTWNEGLEVQYFEDEIWVNSSHDPNFRIFNKSDYESDHPVRSFIKSIPCDILMKVKQFDMNQLTILRLLKEYPISIDILEHSPSVYCILADWVQSNEITTLESVTILKQKRRSILSIIFKKPVSEASIRFLSKYIGNGHDRLELDTLKKTCLDSCILEGFSRIKSFGWNEMRMAARYPFLISYQFFWDAIYWETDISYLLSKLQDTQRLGKQLIIHDYQVTIEDCRTVEELANLHDRWTERMYEVDDEEIERRFLSRYGAQKFPDPPLPGNDNIIPIVNSFELFREVQLLSDFAETYVNEVSNEEIFLYRVYGQERGTIELRIENGKPTAGKFIRPFNKPPNENTKTMIQDWLSSHKKVLGHIFIMS